MDRGEMERGEENGEGTGKGVKCSAGSLFTPPPLLLPSSVHCAASLADRAYSQASYPIGHVSTPVCIDGPDSTIIFVDNRLSE